VSVHRQKYDMILTSLPTQDWLPVYPRTFLCIVSYTPISRRIRNLRMFFRFSIPGCWLIYTYTRPKILVYHRTLSVVQSGPVRGQLWRYSQK
jgi:hypothetical protein